MRRSTARSGNDIGRPLVSDNSTPSPAGLRVNFIAPNATACSGQLRVNTGVELADMRFGKSMYLDTAALALEFGTSESCDASRALQDCGRPSVGSFRGSNRGLRSHLHCVVACLHLQALLAIRRTPGPRFVADLAVRHVWDRGHVNDGIECLSQYPHVM